MAEPILDDTTERVYAQLPQHYRDQDANFDWQLKRYLGGMLSAQVDVNAVIDRLMYIPPEDGGINSTSDLVNPYTADANWLEWLGQLFGTSIQGAITDDTRNEVIEASGFQAGNTKSIIAAAQSVLVGTKKVRIVKHADTSWQPNMNGRPEQIVSTNMYLHPYWGGTDAASTNVATQNWIAYVLGGSTYTLTQGDVYNNRPSVRLTNVGATSNTRLSIRNNIANGNNPALPSGLTFWVAADIYVSSDAQISGTSASFIFRDDPNNNSSAATLDSDSSTRYTTITVGGWSRIWAKATVNTGSTITAIYFTGANASAGNVQPDGAYMQLDNVFVAPVQDGETQPPDYFDGGSDATGIYEYRWAGTEELSLSEKYIPAVSPVTNTAGPWDMLIMTLQSETLKNLLNPALAKTLTPSAWEDTYSSFGYDSQIYRQLVTQPGLYQNRAYSYSLADPNWQATSTITGGFGLGPFGQTTFGYSSDVTSNLQIISREPFDVTPGDSYQFMVSLGLEQAQKDSKISTIGFQFFDSSDELILNNEKINYFPDPSMEYGVAPFDGAITSGTGTIEQSTNEFNSGSYSLVFTNTGSGVAYQTATSSVFGTPTDLDLVVGDTVTASAWVYIPSNTTLYSSLFGLSGTAFDATSYADMSNLSTDKWVQIKTTNIVTNIAGTIAPRIYSGTVTNDIIYFDDFGLTPGTDPVDFSGDTTPPLDGSIVYAWDATPGSSKSYMKTQFFDTPIDIEPTIENPSVVSHNLIKSDKYQFYSPSGTAPSAVDITNYGTYDNGDVIRASINNRATTSDFGITASEVYGMQAVPAGTTFVFSLDYYGDVNANIDGIRPVFNDDTNNDDTPVEFDITTPALVTVTKGRWHTKYWLATVKADRTVTSAGILIESSVNQSQGAYLDTANWKIEEGAVYNPYFNGDTPANDLYTYQWAAIPNESITNKVLTSVAQDNITQMSQFNTRFLAPANAATAKVFVRMLGFHGKDTLYIAQPAVREEVDETWIAETADPVAAVIRKGVKPAGILLHWLPIVSSWDSITSDGTRTWDELDLTWTELEELGA